jgi:hypothetical protein
MSQRSNLGYYERMEDASFTADQPVSAARAWLMRNNLLHLSDMFTQPRINIYRSEIGTDICIFGNQSDPATLIYQHPFFHTWFGEAAPANLDIVMAVQFSIPLDATVRFRVVPHYRPRASTPHTVGDLSLPALVDETVSVTAATFATLDDRFIFDEAEVRQLRIVPTDFQDRMTENGEPAIPQAMVMRLEVRVTSEETDDWAPGIAVCLVREFA